MPPPTGKVGIIIPSISNIVHWLDNIQTVQDALDTVLEQNSFIGSNQLNARLHGRPAYCREKIHPGDIIQVGFKVAETANSLADAFHRMRVSPDETTPPYSGHSQDYNFRGPTNPTHSRYRYAEIPTKPLYPDSWAPRFRRRPRPTNFADRVRPPISKVSLPPLRRRPKRRFKPSRGLIGRKVIGHRKIRLRFHLLELAEEPIEPFATNYEPLQVHFDIVRNKLLRIKCIDKTDELDFHWPHLRWVPRGSTKVAHIRTAEDQKCYGCFVRLRQPRVVESGFDRCDENAESYTAQSESDWDETDYDNTSRQYSRSDSSNRFARTFDQDPLTYSSDGIYGDKEAEEEDPYEHGYYNPSVIGSPCLGNNNTDSAATNATATTIPETTEPKLSIIGSAGGNSTGYNLNSQDDLSFGPSQTPSVADDIVYSDHGELDLTDEEDPPLIWDLSDS
ncbi:hypothetical protein ABW20_dc0105103 [Dactylellina cionopaga]|nr:hypothetical protein ABW20_dc0105103 [Dactylellina cionopaga]